MSVSLKNRLQQKEALLAPGVFDPLTALLVEQVGFEACYLSGASVAYTHLGRPDVGFVSVSQVADVIGRIRDRISIPLIVDADTGFGNAINVQHTVRTFERMGANAIQLEDQVMPKRCGHLAGKELISLEEMAGKVRAAVDARSSEETLIIARTDAIAVEGFSSALERAAAYQASGADVLFVEAPQSIDQMRQITARFNGEIPLLANMVEGGKTPIRHVGDLEDLGFSLVITPGSLARAMSFAAKEMLTTLKKDGTTAAYQGQMMDFNQLNRVLGLEDTLKIGDVYGPLEKDAAE
jgi:2-methylisocitrate lyase-like PEP mutase family enzyme